MLVGIMPVGSDLSPKELSVEPDDLISVLYEKVALEYGVNKENISLTFHGKNLSEHVHKTLDEMDIRKGSQIDFVNAPPGGH
jgi:hypothetical protein